MRRRGLLLAPFVVTSARAQRAFPDRPIRLLIPFAAGGPADLLGRIFANALGTALGGTVVAESRAGAGGVTALEATARAAPDGHTLVLSGAGGLVVAPAMGPMPLDVFADLFHLTLVARVPQLVAVHPALGVIDIAGLAAAMRARPGGGTYGSAGVGSTTHLAAALLAREAGFEATHVPYRGIAPAITDLLARRVDYVIADIPVLRPHVEAGALRPLALASGARLPRLADVPTTSEAGVPRVLSDNFYGLAAPAALAEVPRARLLEAAMTALHDPALTRDFARADALPAPLSPEETVAFLRAEQAKWAPLVRETGATAG